ncbi:MAG TPA: FkbM family methyltransferase [Terriglobales bacterium]|nr:FkbM family methyltransferase [Terriglobales bacterium]
MSFTTLLKKAAAAGSLARGRDVKLGDRAYHIKGLLANPLALNSARWQEKEPWLDAIIKIVLQCREGAFLDVGANLGQTMFKVLALDSSRQYVGFEPQIACCLMLQRFLDENHITSFSILPVGLFNTNRVMKIHGGGSDYDATASVVDGFRPDSFYTSDRYICVRKGDDVVSELGVTSVCGIKVDVEGAELEVFEGLVDTIERTNPFLIFEVLNHFLVVTGSKLDDQTLRFRESRIARLESLLRPRGYEVFNILPPNELSHVSQIVPVVSDDLSLTNYIAVPKSELDAFLRAFETLGGTVRDLIGAVA